MFDLLLLILSFCRPARILRWSVFLLAVTIGWLALENSTLQAYIQERERRNGYREQVDQLKQQQKQLETDIADLKAGGFRLEKAIRERFHLIKPGEKIIYIESPGDKAPAPDSREELNAALLQATAASPTPAPVPAEATEAAGEGDDAAASKKPASRAAAEDEPAIPAAKKKAAGPAKPVARASVTKKSAGAKTSSKGTESGAKSSKSSTSSTKSKRTKKRPSTASSSDNQ